MRTWNVGGRGTAGRLFLGATLAIAAAGCGSSSGSSQSPATPPDGTAVALAAAPLLAPFGLQVQRSSIEQKPDPRGGSELSLYVRPTRTETPDAYAKRFAPLATAVVPQLLEKYPGLAWIDLCQEPAKSSGDWETVPLTRLEISRSGAGLVDWERADAAQMLAMQRTRPLEVSIAWHKSIGRTRVWKDASARALTLDG